VEGGPIRWRRTSASSQNVTQTFKIPFFTKTEIKFQFFRLSDDGYQNVDIFDEYLNGHDYIPGQKSPPAGRFILFHSEF